MAESPLPEDEAPRTLSPLAWALAVLFFPTGVFIALGSARLLSWPRSIAWALLSYGSVIGFVGLMHTLERSGAREAVRTMALTGGMLMIFAWALMIYRIGRRASYWSPAVLRGWRRAGWFAVAAMALGAVNATLHLLRP